MLLFWDNIKISLLQYSGTGRLFSAFLLSLFVLYYLERDKKNRGHFLYPSFLLLFFALILWSGKKEGAEYLLPVIPVTAYAAAQVLAKAKGWKQRAAVLFGLVLLAALSGGAFWEPKGGSPNEMKLEAGAVEVFERLLAADENPRALMPYGLALACGQYTSRIDTLYNLDLDTGLEPPLGFSETAVKLYHQMEASSLDSKLLARISRREGYPYIVLEKGTHFPDLPLEILDYECIASLQDWNIYKYTR